MASSSHASSPLSSPQEGACNQEETPNQEAKTTTDPLKKDTLSPTHQKEIGGPKGLEPTRYGDWEKNGRCYDF